MENYLNQNFGGVKSKNSSDEALQRWRRLCSVVKNPKRRFRFTANLSKRSEAAAMKRTNQVLLLILFLFVLNVVCLYLLDLNFVTNEIICDNFVITEALI